jgi:uncharacterized protein (UPF0276 family)
MPSAQSPAARDRFARQAIPARAGIGLRHVHFEDFIERRPNVGWLEIHTENYLGPGGPRLRALEEIRTHYPLSCHGVGLSLGSADGLNPAALTRRRTLFDRFAPGLLSEHIAWSIDHGVYLNDLMPLPYNEESLSIIVDNIDQAQTAFGDRLFVENPSSYVGFEASTMAEAEFMAAVIRHSGCGLLLDVNNVFVTAHNYRLDAIAYLSALPLDAIGEIHVAGHLRADIDGETMLIDDHGSKVTDPVWDLLGWVLERAGPRPVLVEWDTNVPDLAVLLAEADRAQAAIDRVNLNEATAPAGVGTAA